VKPRAERESSRGGGDRRSTGRSPPGHPVSYLRQPAVPPVLVPAPTRRAGPSGLRRGSGHEWQPQLGAHAGTEAWGWP